MTDARDTEADTEADTDTVRDKPDPSGTSGLFEQRAYRSWFVNGLVILALAGVTWSVWPTEARRLERRAKEYLSASFKGDAKSAYQFLSPASRQRLPMDVWWTANRTRLANSEVVEAAIDTNGQSATVTLKDTRSKVARPTVWVKSDGVWWHDYDGK